MTPRPVLPSLLAQSNAQLRGGALLLRLCWALVRNWSSRSAARSAGKPEESDFVPERRHSIANGTDPEKRLLDSKRKAAPSDPNGTPAATTLAVSPAAPAGSGEQQPTEAKRSAANPYGLSAELLKAKLEFDQKRRAAVALGKFTCRHQ